MQINSCVNPFIYAAVLPEFKKTVRNIFNGNQFGIRSSKSSNLSTSVEKQEMREVAIAAVAARKMLQLQKERKLRMDNI